MATVTIPGNPPIAAKLVRTRAFRRISLRVSRADGSVTLTVPARVDLRSALDFAERRRNWLLSQIESCWTPIRPAYGISFPLEGRQRLIEPAASRLPSHDGSKLLVPGPSDRVAANLRAYCKWLANRRLEPAARKHAAEVGRGVVSVSLRDPKTRWGSCSVPPGARSGRLNFSWRLIMAPPEVLDYVAAHEAAHLVEMNHSRKFWSLVESLCPRYRAHSAWLKKNGASLHRYSFSDSANG